MAIFVAGGYYDGPFSSDRVQVLDPPPSDGHAGSPSCPAMQPLPRRDHSLLPMDDASGNPVLCGGAGNPDPVSCLVLDSGTWTGAPFAMAGPHRSGRAVKISTGLYWVLGDVDG